MSVKILEIRENEIIVSEKLYSELSIVAIDKGISVSELVNEYIKEGLENA